MLYFASDYQEGCHPAVLQRLIETNLEPTPGYGTDAYCEAAREKIRAACRCPGEAVYFLVGGTQTNATVIDGLLRPWEGVLAAQTGHIGVHEAGAIEAGGHKVLPLPQEAGKISADSVRAYMTAFRADENASHMVQPGLVYISQPTEYGTLYSLAELTALSEVCHAFGLPLYVDGARLAYALSCPANDVNLPDLARLTDAFYIGGTKCGLLCGEAVVLPDAGKIPGFFTLMKQHGALLAKGRLLGVQFDTLFTGGLYERIGQPAQEAADAIRRLLAELAVPIYLETPTNQIFISLANAAYQRLQQTVQLSYWEPDGPDRTVARIATGWATRAEDVERLGAALRAALAEQPA